MKIQEGWEVGLFLLQQVWGTFFNLRATCCWCVELEAKGDGAMHINFTFVQASSLNTFQPGENAQEGIWNKVAKSVAGRERTWFKNRGGFGRVPSVWTSPLLCYRDIYSSGVWLALDSVKWWRASSAGYHSTASMAFWAKQAKEDYESGVRLWPCQGPRWPRQQSWPVWR